MLYQILPFESPLTSCVASSSRGNSYSVMTHASDGPAAAASVTNCGSSESGRARREPVHQFCFQRVVEAARRAASGSRANPRHASCAARSRSSHARRNGCGRSADRNGRNCSWWSAASFPRPFRTGSAAIRCPVIWAAISRVGGSSSSLVTRVRLMSSSAARAVDRRHSLSTKG